MIIVPDASMFLKLVLQETSDPDHDDAIRFRLYQIISSQRDLTTDTAPRFGPAFRHIG